MKKIDLRIVKRILIARNEATNEIREDGMTPDDFTDHEFAKIVQDYANGKRIREDEEEEDEDDWIHESDRPHFENQRRLDRMDEGWDID